MATAVVIAAASLEIGSMYGLATEHVKLRIATDWTITMTNRAGP